MTKFPMKVKFVRKKNDRYPCHTTGFTYNKIYEAIALVKYNQFTCFVVSNDEGRFVHASIESFALPKIDDSTTCDCTNDNNDNNVCTAYVSSSLRYKADE